MTSFAEKIVKLRKDKGYTQEELAKRLFVSRQAVSKWETENNLPSIDIIKALSKEFDVSLNSLIDSADICEISLNTDKNVEHIKKVNLTISIGLIIALALGIIGSVFGIMLNKKNNENIVKQETYVGVFLDVNTEQTNRDAEIISLDYLENLNLPFLVAMKNLSDNAIPYTSYHSYGIGGGVLDISNLGETISYTDCFLFYDPTKSPKILMQLTTAL